MTVSSGVGQKATILGKLRRRVRAATRRLGFDIVRAYPPQGKWTVGAIDVSVPSAFKNGRLWVSFSLYGTDVLYVRGIVSACESYSDLFPGWTPIVFVGDSVPHDVVSVLQNDFNAVIVPMDSLPEDPSAMFWRYLAVDAVTYGAILFRDADSRASRRERAAVDEWLASDRSFHIMRDHPNHTHPMMGGTWGIRVDGAPRLGQLVADYGPDGEFSGDQRWLASEMYPVAAASCLVHQDSCLYLDAPSVVVRPFPVAEGGSTFVGQGVLPDGRPRPGHEAP